MSPHSSTGSHVMERASKLNVGCVGLRDTFGHYCVTCVTLHRQHRVNKVRKGDSAFNNVFFLSVKLLTVLCNRQRIKKKGFKLCNLCVV